MGRHAPRVSLPVYNPDDSDSGMHSASDVEGTSQSDDEYASEYDSKRGTKTKVAAPLAKRSRLSASSKHASPAKAPSRRKKNLSLFPTMPLDILFEILASLDPKDLLSVSRTNKSFRETLYSRTAQSVWKNSRKQFGAPDCPRDLNEGQWASLLFGSRCELCGAKGVPRADFYLRRRVCVRCKKANYIVRHKALSEFPDSEAILLLIPSTNVGGWSHGHASSSQFYWKPDILAMVRKLATFEHEKHMRTAGAQANLDEFKQKRYTLIAEISSHAIQCKSWAADLASHRAEETEEKVAARKQAICDKFIALGYTEEDIKRALSFKREYEAKAGLTDRIWKRIQPILEPLIQTVQEERKAREFAAIRRERARIVQQLYKTFKGSLQPREWKHLPSSLEIARFEPFSRCLKAPPETKITPESFGDVVTILPKLLTDAQDALKATLLGLIASKLEAGEVLHPNALDLAKSVFKCQKHPKPIPHELYVVGTDKILSHHCSQESYHDYIDWGYRDPFEVDASLPDLPFYIEPLGISIAEVLIRCAGLNPETALASDMDARDLRFKCVTGATCQLGYFGYSWRAAISHGAGEHAKIPISDQKWTVLSVEQADCIKNKEAADLKWNTHNWICAHCSMGVQGRKPKEVVRTHVREEHQITEPATPRDFFYFEQCVSPFKNPGAINYRSVCAPMAQGVSKNIRCKHCTGPRLFDIGGIVCHVKAKHNIKVVQEGVDWIMVPAVL